MERMLFADSTLLDGIPQLLASEPWVQARSIIRAREKAKFLQKVSESQRYTNAELLPERLMDLFALDALLYQYRDTEPIGRKIENLKNAFMLWSTAGTLGAAQMVADIFFDGAATVLQWFEYGGEHNHFRVDIVNNSLPWAELSKYMEISFYFRRLSQMLDGLRTILQGSSVTLYMGAATIERHFETVALAEKATVYAGAVTIERHCDQTYLEV